MGVYEDRVVPDLILRREGVGRCWVLFFKVGDRDPPYSGKKSTRSKNQRREGGKAGRREERRTEGRTEGVNDSYTVRDTLLHLQPLLFQSTLGTGGSRMSNQSSYLSFSDPSNDSRLYSHHVPRPPRVFSS